MIYSGVFRSVIDLPRHLRVRVDSGDIFDFRIVVFVEVDQVAVTKDEHLIAAGGAVDQFIVSRDHAVDIHVVYPAVCQLGHLKIRREHHDAGSCTDIYVSVSGLSYLTDL